MTDHTDAAKALLDELNTVFANTVRYGGNPIDRYLEIIQRHLDVARREERRKIAPDLSVVLNFVIEGFPGYEDWLQWADYPKIKDEPWGQAALRLQKGLEADDA